MALPKYRIRIELTSEQHQIIADSLKLIGAKTVDDAIHGAIDAQLDACKSLLAESGRSVAAKPLRVKISH